MDPIGLVHPRGKIGRGVFKEVARVRSAGAEENSVGGEAGVFGDDVFKCSAGFVGVKEGVGETLDDLVWRDAASLVHNNANIGISKSASRYSGNTTSLHRFFKRVIYIFPTKRLVRRHMLGANATINRGPISKHADE